MTYEHWWEDEQMYEDVYLAQLQKRPKSGRKLAFWIVGLVALVCLVNEFIPVGR